MNTKTTSILVTGATGYIASWVIKNLLEQGHTVHATVRDLNKKNSFAHLENIANQSAGTLKLFQANLLTPHAFDEAMQGCEIVLHMASPICSTVGIIIGGAIGGVSAYLLVDAFDEELEAFTQWTLF